MELTILGYMLTSVLVGAYLGVIAFKLASKKRRWYLSISMISFSYSILKMVMLVIGFTGGGLILISTISNLAILLPIVIFDISTMYFTYCSTQYRNRH